MALTKPNNLVIDPGYATTATAAGTTTLTVNSKPNQFFTGSTTQTITLPVVSTLYLGFSFIIANKSSGALTVNSSGANLVQSVAASATVRLTCIAITGTSDASWSAEYFPPSSTAIKTFIVQDQKSQGTDGGASSVGTNTRTLNTSVTNSISGASLSSNQITLPAGTYNILAWAQAFNTSRNKLYLYNVTDSSVAVTGLSQYAAGTSVSLTAFAAGSITIAGTKVFELRQYFETGNATNGLGNSNNISGFVEVYSCVHITQAA